MCCYGTRVFKRYLSNMAERIKTFVFFDLETTGLPSFEFNKTKVTEICLTAVQAEHLDLGVFPRVQNKLSLCVNPLRFISTGSSLITGLYNDFLDNQSQFDAKTVNVIKGYLSLHRSPMCLVAHNGNRFDFPILREHFYYSGNELDNDVLCIDSLLAFKSLEQPVIEPEANTSTDSINSSIPDELMDDLDDVALNQAFDEVMCDLMQDTPTKAKRKFRPKQTPNEQSKARRTLFTESPKKNNPIRLSYKLVDVYQRLLSKPALEGHRAENDVEMLIACSAKYGQGFTDWANTNAQKFCEITPMKSGRQFGAS